MCRERAAKQPRQSQAVCKARGRWPEVEHHPRHTALEPFHLAHQPVAGSMGKVIPQVRVTRQATSTSTISLSSMAVTRSTSSCSIATPSRALARSPLTSTSPLAGTR